MQQTITLKIFENINLKETEDLLNELNNYEELLTELEIRIENIKNLIKERVTQTNNLYLSQKWNVELKTIIQKRKDLEKIEEKLKELGININHFIKEISYKKLFIHNLN